MELPLLQVDIKSLLEQVLNIQRPASSPSNVVSLRPPPSPETVRAMLAVLSPDLPYDDWRNVVWSIKATGLPEAEALAREWSERGGKWDAGAFHTVWESFRPDGVGVGTLVHLAREAGWQGDLWSAPSIRYRLLSGAAIRAMPPLRWRVKGVLPETGIAAVYGPSGSGKSFLAFDLACAVAEGEPWFGHRTYAGPVTYVMLEGEAGLSKRWQAWEARHERDVPETVAAIAQPFDITSSDVEALAEVLPRDGIVIIDTLNRAAPGKDENNSLDMGAIITGAKALQARAGGLVVLVHHTGKDASKGLRGHSSLHAALDAAVEVKRDGDGRSWSVAKSKDSEDGETRNFKLEVVWLGVDEEGDPVTSCVAVPDVDRLLIPKEPAGANQKLALQIIRGKMATMFGPWPEEDQRARLSMDDIVGLVAEHMGGERKRRKPRAKEAITGLISSRHLCAVKGGEGVYALN